MKKLLTLTAAVLAFSAAPALADNHGKDAKGPKGGMFEQHDTNGDGVVSQDEFLDHAKARFGEMDTDGDGKISREEAQAHRTEMKEKWKERREERMEKREERKEMRKGAPAASGE